LVEAMARPAPSWAGARHGHAARARDRGGQRRTPEQSSEAAQQLRINVTSPGGTTAEALKILMARTASNGIRQGAGGSVATVQGTGRMKSTSETALDAFLA